LGYTGFAGRLKHTICFNTKNPVFGAHTAFVSYDSHSKLCYFPEQHKRFVFAVECFMWCGTCIFIFQKRIRPQVVYHNEIRYRPDTSGSGEGQVMDFCGHGSINGRVQYLIINWAC